ncbi:polymorphic toxin-type HINT domain-containing protein [Agromyces seonyuensis]|uniref:polymorphic toxin-type HINT domain-containing protein n=1 Tax=Agromyces seonyuensis TaxID=2662446 RepID=UPI0013666C13|nr:polymorphic toxin-type HINT domain-containing protein [Agromyces seonyuensis]
MLQERNETQADSIDSVARLYTDPFGGERGQVGADLPGDRRFLGATFDDNIAGLTLIGARHYDARNGQFISTDPQLDPGTPAQFNAYVYSGHNPVTWSDPTGMSWLGDMFKAGKKAAKAVGGFVNKYKAEIAGAVVGGLATAGCLALTAGAGSIGCAIAGGAIAGAVTNVVRTATTGQKFSWSGFATETLIGAAGGLLGGAGAVVFKAVAPAVKAAASAVMAPTRAATAAAAGSGARAAASQTASTATKAAAAVKNAAGSSCKRANSFVPGTLVVLASGAVKAIENLDIGEEVLATDPNTGETAAKPVTALITGDGEKDLTTITIDDGTGGTGTLEATDGHPFWVPERDRWVDSGDLLPGDWLQTASGTLVQITAIEHDHRPQTVHNLTVADIHTYYVQIGESEVLVHNCNGLDAGLGGLDDATYNRIDDTFGPDIADGVDYQVKRMHDGSASSADHDIPGIGHDPDALADYFSAWRGNMTHVDAETGANVAFDSGRGVLLVQTGRNIHGYRYTQLKFESGRYIQR